MASAVCILVKLIKLGVARWGHCMHDAEEASAHSLLWLMFVEVGVVAGFSTKVV